MKMKKIKNVILVYDDGSITNHSSASALNILKKENKEKVKKIKLENKKIKDILKMMKYQKSKQILVFFEFFNIEYGMKVEEINDIFMTGIEKEKAVEELKNKAIRITAKYFGIHRDTVADKLTRQIGLYSEDITNLLFDYINFNEKYVFDIIIDNIPFEDRVHMKKGLNIVYGDKIW